MEAYRNPALPPEQRAEDLLPRMTLREKIGQLTQRLYGFAVYERSGSEITFTREFEEEVARYGGLGALYGLHRADPWSKRDDQTGLAGTLSEKARNQAQAYVMAHSRFGIPVLFSSECPHGHQAIDGYLLPVNLASGCSFSPELLRAAAEVAGQQLRVMGVDLALVSALDILRDPRWGRSEECFGEDPFLAAQMAQAVICGIQSRGVDVVAKHLCAQGETTGGVNASAARIGPRELREIHLPAVRAAVQAGVSAVMAAYNEIDGVYCHANPKLLTGILREEYGFRGFVMSDGIAIDQLDAVTGNRTASGALALNAGVDMGLWDTGMQRLEEAVRRGLTDEATIDRAAKRILTLKFRRGLFEHPFVPETGAYQSYTQRTYPQAQTLAEHSLVLLKNDKALLPLEKHQTIGLVGPNADALYNQLGDYTPPLRPENGTTLRQGLQALGAQVVYAGDFSMFDGADGCVCDALERLKDCDILVAALGGTSSRFAAEAFRANGAAEAQQRQTMDCGENVDCADLRLPGRQTELLQALHATGKPVVTVLIGGRPYAMEQIDRNSDALVCAFYPGPEGGRAIAGLLLGEVLPAGRLCVSLPDTAGQLPVYYNAKDSYRPGAYCDRGRPKYGFGFGLSGTEFAFAPLELPAADRRALTFRVTNVGPKPGWTVPQLYLHRAQGITTSRVRQLCGFAKQRLEPGEGCVITIPIPEESLVQWDWDEKPKIPGGRIEWFLSDGGRDALTGKFFL